MTMNEREYLLKNTYLEIFEFRICNSLAPSKCIFKGWNFKWIKLFAQSDVEKEILFPKRMNSIMYYTYYDKIQMTKKWGQDREVEVRKCILSNGIM